MNSPQKNQCYCCKKIATTRDHIPPKCFFPQPSHLADANSDYRSHLITVPACVVHNNLRSRDDEYTAAVILMNSKSDLAFKLFRSKWIQRVLRQERILGKQTFSMTKIKRVTVKNEKALVCYKALAVSYDMKRIERVIEAIARALYYLESGYQEKWASSCAIRSPNLFHHHSSYLKNTDSLDQINHYFHQADNYQELAKKGTYPDVFYYQFLKFKDKKFIIRMVFYDDFVFLVSPTQYSLES